MRIGEIADRDVLGRPLCHANGGRRERRQITAGSEDGGRAEVSGSPQDGTKIVRILHAVEIQERALQPPLLDRPQQVGHPPSGTCTGEDHDPLVVRRFADAGEVLLRHDLKAEPRLRAVVEECCKVPAAVLSDVDANDVSGPAGKQRLARPRTVKLLLGLALMTRRRSIRFGGDGTAAGAGGWPTGRCRTTRRGAGTLHGVGASGWNELYGDAGIRGHGNTSTITRRRWTRHAGVRYDRVHRPDRSTG
jgi:hypothetical protein